MSEIENVISEIDGLSGKIDGLISSKKESERKLRDLMREHIALQDDYIELGNKYLALKGGKP